jgi:hypothetical protein
MIRNLKALGVAVVALAAMSAIAASSASAHKITVSNNVYPQTLIGTDVPPADTFVIGSNVISCEGETYTATLAAPSTTIEATPEYGETCQTVGTDPHWNVTVTENGCKIHFEWSEHVATDHDKVKVKVVCPTGKVIEIHHYNGSTPHKDPICTNTVGAQTAVGTLTATSLTKTATTGDILLEGTVHLTEQTHEECSFGFTINQTAEFNATTTIETKSGVRVHIE